MGTIGPYAIVTIFVVLFKPADPQTSGVKIIESPQVTNRGVWGPLEYCPPQSFAYQFVQKFDAYGLFKDDTGLNAIRIVCHNPRTRWATGVISSTEGSFGSWNRNFYPLFPEQEPCLYFVGFVLRSEENQGSGDDTGANEIRFKCATGGWTRSWPSRYGVFTEPQYCDKGQAICGIQTQVEPNQGYEDDSSLNNVRFACCKCPRCPREWQPHTANWDYYDY